MHFTSFPFLMSQYFKKGQGRTYILSCIPSQELPITSGFVVTLSKNVFQRTFSFLTGVGLLSLNFLPPLILLQSYVIFFNLPNLFLFFFVLGAGLEPARTQCPMDFKSIVSTDSTTQAFFQYVKEHLLVCFTKICIIFYIHNFSENKKSHLFWRWDSKFYIITYHTISIQKVSSAIANPLKDMICKFFICGFISFVINI